MATLVTSLARLTSSAVAALVLVWALAFPSSFTSSHSNQIYSVLHPLLMVIGLIIISGEAIMAHQSLSRFSRRSRKSVHLGLQGTAFGLGVFGIWAKFRGKDGIVANFYSLHSWMGLLCLSLFAAQWVVGFVNFFDRIESRRARATVLPWHVFVGLYTYVLAVVTAQTGLLEKLTFLHARRAGESARSTESMIVNGLGLGLALLCGLVILAAVLPKKVTYETTQKDHKLMQY
ncbi:putative transmembrane ascorbate ferrireductase 4 [Acorus calamus]|uniref:Transmembrane ascorbate ferrireductase 4 n=1 Tax=Acorus calamus TaxID=4465 RepID=A0AAV9DPL2_ACOCL|nr:putative transmembrane ascorbate ferrireductase 4 [Acorus calamus]